MALLVRMLFVVSSFLVVQLVASFSSRHVAFMKKYGLAEGPHFVALFDELFDQTGFEEKRAAFFTLSSSQSLFDSDEEQLVPSLEKRQLDLGMTDCETFYLDKLNPIELEKQMARFRPTILWVSSENDTNSFALRYSMRTSGLDGFVEENCGSEDCRSLLFVGEGDAAVICSGADMAVARALGHDPKGAPEPQFRGLELLGNNQSFLYGDTEGLKQCNRIEDTDSVTTLKYDQVYVWSQVNGDDTYSFVMNARQKGAIEAFRSPVALPPMVELDVGGRKCIGEPSVDPSRRLQMRGDSEWFEEGGV